MNRKRRLAALGLAAALLAACSTGADDPAPRAGYVPQGPANTVADEPTTTSTTPTGTGAAVGVPETEDEFVEVEGERLVEEDDPAPTPPPVLTKVDRSDPEAVAANWGCAYRSEEANETSTEWVERLMPLAVDTAADKLPALAAGSTPSTTSARIVGAAKVGGGTWRADCDTNVFGPDGEFIRQLPPNPVMMKLVETKAGWAVSDFSYGGIDFGPVEHRIG